MQMRDDEEQAAKEAPERRLPPPPLRNTASTSTMALPTDDEGFMTVQGRKSHDKRLRDPSKDPTLRRRPSKASHLPLPFPLRSEAERVAKVHTLFKSVTHETRPSSPWVYDRLRDYYSQKTKEQLVYFSNMLCLAILEFHLTCGCTATGMCSPCCHRSWRLNCLHWRSTSMNMRWRCKMFASSVKPLLSASEYGSIELT